jgi:hypothetical protein
MIDLLQSSRFELDELFNEINDKLTEEKKPIIDRQDLSTLLGIGLWCGLIDKKMALVFLKMDML